jgi:hypothetical protein
MFPFNVQIDVTSKHPLRSTIIKYFMLFFGNQNHLSDQLSLSLAYTIL